MSLERFVEADADSSFRFTEVPIINQRSLRDSPILHRVCVGEMLLLKAICDALTH